MSHLFPPTFFLTFRFFLFLFFSFFFEGCHLHPWWICLRGIFHHRFFFFFFFLSELSWALSFLSNPPPIYQEREGVTEASPKRKEKREKRWNGVIMQEGRGERKQTCERKKNWKIRHAINQYNMLKVALKTHRIVYCTVTLWLNQRGGSKVPKWHISLICAQISQHRCFALLVKWWLSENSPIEIKLWLKSKQESYLVASWTALPYRYLLQNVCQNKSTQCAYRTYVCTVVSYLQ